MKRNNIWQKSLWCLIAMLGVAVMGVVATPNQATAVATDDQVLFNAAGYSAPNVMFLIDTSGSMRTIIVHATYTPGDGVSSDCKVAGNGYYGYSSDTTYSTSAFGCGGPNRTIYIYTDPNISGSTWYEGDYLNWLFDSKTPSSVFTDLAMVNDKVYKCLRDGSGNLLKYSMYRRARVTAAEKAVEDVICLANQGGGDPVRFGVARFRPYNYSTNNDTGGWVIVPNMNYSDVYQLDGNNPGGVSKSQDVQLSDRLSADISADGATPLAESLFQTYTYFMSRDGTKRPWVMGSGSGGHRDYSCTDCSACNSCDKWTYYDYYRSLGYGKKKSKKKSKNKCANDYNTQNWPGCWEWVTAPSKKYFPPYEYRTSDGVRETTNLWKVPDTPVSGMCQSNYTILLSDGEPTSDTFGDSVNEALGFADVQDLIGGKTLDAIAKVMYELDMFPDASNPSMPGKQNVKVYTVGFNAPLVAQQLLARTATNGGGRNFNTSDTETLTKELNKVVLEMVAGAQSFAASSVPSSRQSLGSYFYTSFFEYTPSDPFWEGHLMSLNMSIGGGIFDKHWTCALKNPNSIASCRNGDLMLDELKKADPSSPYFLEPVFDVATLLTSPSTRNLYMGVPTAFGTVASGMKQFTTAGVAATDFGITTAGEAASYAGAFARDLGLTAGQVSGAGLDTMTNEQLADVLVEYGRGCLLGSVEYSGSCTVRTNQDGDPKLLGDIFHSAPLLLGSPNGFGLGPAYIAFRNQVKWRPLMIYVGANDGFLHAFKAGEWDCTPGPCSPTEFPDTFVPSGEELFGFMPWTARNNFKNFPIDTGTQRDYYFVDGSPVYADIWINRQVNAVTKMPTGSRIPGATTKVKEQWRTVLIGGMRQGGSSYYALDVTNPPTTPPTSPAPPGGFPGYLWEFPCEVATVGGCSNPLAALYVDPGSGAVPVTNSEGLQLDAYLGETWSDPVITRVRVHVGTDDVDRWVAIVGGGYDPTGDPHHPAYDSSDVIGTSRKGRAIFMIDIATGNILASRRFDPTGGNLLNLGENQFRYAFPSSAVVDDANSDGYTDTIYIGDLGGNIWRWDVSAAGYDVGVDESQSNWPLQLFFSAGGNRSFYYPPVIATGSNSNLRWLIAATGNRSNIMDMGIVSNATDNDRIYVIRDITGYPLAALPLSESNLMNLSTLDPLLDKATYQSQVAASNGYYMIAGDGEKFVSRLSVLQGKVTAGSFSPSTAVGCVQTGESFYYEFYFTSSFGAGNASAVDPEKRKRSIGVGLPRDPRPSYGTTGNTTGTCSPGDATCSCVGLGPCCLVPAGGWSVCDATCGRCSMSIGGASSGGTSAECASCSSAFLPGVRSWREE